MRDSGVIEDVADVICFIHRPEYYGMKVDEDNVPISQGLAEVIIAKNRHGETDTIRFTFDKDICRFCEYDDAEDWDISTSALNSLVDSNSPF